MDFSLLKIYGITFHGGGIISTVGFTFRSQWLLGLFRRLCFVTVLVYSSFPTFLHAQTQDYIEYQYDGAGNIIGIITKNNGGQPDVTSLVPDHVNRDKTITISAAGVNLYKAQVATDHDGITILNTETISSELVKFTISSKFDAEIGFANFTFTTRLGRDIESIFVAIRLPVISTDPNPIALVASGPSRPVSLTFDLPYPTDQEFNLAASNTSLAKTNVGSVTLEAGSTEASFFMAGLEKGVTTLEVSQPAAFSGVSIPVFVSDPFDLPNGNTEFTSKSVGVTVSRFDLSTGESEFVLSTVGVLRNANELIVGDKFVHSNSVGISMPAPINELPSGNAYLNTEPLGVLKNSENMLPEGESYSYSDLLGININTEFLLPNGDASLLSDALGVTNPPYINNRSHGNFSQGSSLILILTGVGLDVSRTVIFEPTTGITQSSVFVVNPAGTQIEVFLDISPTASLGPRQIKINTLTGAVPFIQSTNEIFQTISN